MSCFNCYSARKIDSVLIDNILVQGQKLRSAMVQSILNKDPLNADVICGQQKSVKLDDLSKDTNEKIRAFLQGDSMTREDEIQTLETLRSMSAADLCRATDKTFRSEVPCDCLTCVEYHEKDLKCDLKRSNEITEKIQEKYKSEVGHLLKFVDSFKVSVNSVVLNDAGHKKVAASLKDKAAGVGQTFFLEYQIPEVLARNHQKHKSKVDSGLDFGNTVRLCARGSHLQGIFSLRNPSVQNTFSAISFKQVSIHDCDLSVAKLEEATITFRLSFRNFKQKLPVSLGVAKFNFTSFEVSRNLACHQELALRLNDRNPIVIGGLKISVQLGCGRLYFGKEFLDAISNNKENSVVLGSDDLSSTDSDRTEKILDYYPSRHINIPELKLVPSITELEPRKPVFRKPEPQKTETQKTVQVSRRPSHKTEPQTKKSESTLKTESTRRTGSISTVAQNSSRKPESALKKTESTQRAESISWRPELAQSSESPKPVLFGFVYVSEAQFSREVMNSYLRCQMFVSEDVCCSKSVAFDSNPFYNFSQQVPVICEDDFLLKLRENFMVVEFFEKGQKDFLLGLSKVPLHQFYLAYRNPLIVKYLSERKLPVIGTDGWEPICNSSDGEVIGQAQFLVALGTKEQIDNLEKERGFKKDSVRAKTPVKKTVNVDESVKAKPQPLMKKSVDVGVQSTLEPNKDIMEPTKEIETFLNQIAQKTESPENPETEMRSTSDLFESLQKALSVDTKTSFKAHVIINSALHLPSRRKCKSKRSKTKNGKHEDILPSTYVTFEDCKGDLKVTPIVPKNTAPKWDFRCDVSLPIEYLTDNQKFLVFKVWRKSTNTTMTPNMQVDHVIGFATVDLTVLSAGLPSVQGWFNINDLSKKCNGQINIHVTPLENVLKYQGQKCCVAAPSQPPEAPFEPEELLGRALKRKFTELDEITQRLRLRLSKVTNDESDASNDEIADEFERDINTLCVEDDFDMVNFEKEARHFNLNHLKEVGLLKADQQLDKQKLDQMLEKLSLISGETSSRYVSGCSDGRLDTEAILTELDHDSRPNLYSSGSFNREMVEKFGGLPDEQETNSD